MRCRLRIMLVVTSLAVLAVPGCKDPQHFSEPERHIQFFADFENVVMAGRFGQPADPAYVFPVTVSGEPDMVHPHFEGRWTFADPEKPIDVYVFPAASYDPSVPPGDQANVYWTSFAGTDVSQQRQTELHLHPYPGNWVVVFYNPAPNVLSGRSEIASEIRLTYFH